MHNLRIINDIENIDWRSHGEKYLNNAEKLRIMSIIAHLNENDFNALFDKNIDNYLKIK
mgnify:FL=1